MLKDKFNAVWISHSSISDYLKCPRAYLLKHVYRDPKTHHKLMLMQPALALGQAVHRVIEDVSRLPVEERLRTPLGTRLNAVWETVAGKKGGFISQEEEMRFRSRAEDMLSRISSHPGPLTKKAIKIRRDLPYYWLSEEDNIMLCGKVDWLEYNDVTDSVKIIDFKTGKYDEDPDSLQLPIYYLLVTHCQTKAVSGAAYWYLDRDDAPIDMPLPDAAAAGKDILDAGKRIALARRLERFPCPKKDGCSACRPYESIVAGRAEFVGVSDYQDIYILALESSAETE
ncbi:PD-(D/E)XK nuclease family protein [Patescibacteria group bacterium]|nr:PD-(D/E)XK nuclease family protein [Patescibacteria group bacterium]